MLNISIYFIIFMIYSILGWFIEVTDVMIEEKKVVNRGFLIGPYCPIYGFAGLTIVLLLKRYENDLVALFVMSFAVCGVLEYLTSYILEKIFNTRWWDYSHIKFNINGRVCFRYLIVFGIFGVLLVKFINAFFLGLVSSISDVLIYIVAIILFIVLLTDVVISGNIIFKFKGISKNIRFDSTEKITKFVKEEILKKNKILYNRIVDAFPKFRVNLKFLNKKDKH